MLPPLLERLHVNTRAGEVITGIALAAVLPGLSESSWLPLLAEVGLIVLMFEIGLEIDIDDLKEGLRKSVVCGVFAFAAPFAVVFGTLQYFGAVSRLTDLSFDLRKLSIYAPCITITVTAAGIGTEMGVLPRNLFNVLVISGLILTVLGPLGSRFLPEKIL